MNEFSTITHLVIVSSMAIVPVYLFTTYLKAGIGWKKSLLLTLGIIIYSTVMLLFILRWQFVVNSHYLNAVIMLASLALPPTLVLAWPNFFVPEKISLVWLLGVQAFRVIGGLYLLEYFRGNVGSEFAYWAGVGDVITGIAASVILCIYWFKNTISEKAVLYTILFGIADFTWAYSIGILSFKTSYQLFSKDVVHATNLYPIAMIPFLLAPIAMGFMVMTLIKLRRR
ncbi:MAG: hypothetical protein AAF518_13535 [Spirochaetota bacterium]